jgi:hypothetical protein
LTSQDAGGVTQRDLDLARTISALAADAGLTPSSEGLALLELGLDSPDAAVAAGGTLVSDDEAPAFWVLADPEGNRMCLCTWQERTP